MSSELLNENKNNENNINQNLNENKNQNENDAEDDSDSDNDEDECFCCKERKPTIRLPHYKKPELWTYACKDCFYTIRKCGAYDVHVEEGDCGTCEEAREMQYLKDGKWISCKTCKDLLSYNPYSDDTDDDDEIDLEAELDANAV